MIAELDGLVDTGWNGTVFFVDDNFIGNKRLVKEFLRALVAWRERRRPQVDFLTEASVNLADDQELLDLMATAGFQPRVSRASKRRCRRAFRNARSIRTRTAIW